MERENKEVNRYIRNILADKDYVDKFMHHQSKLLLAAAKSQQETNDAHLKRHYANYKTAPHLR